MFQNNQYGKFLSGFIVFTITLFEAASIVEDRFDVSVDSSWLVATTMGVLFLRLASWLWLWSQTRGQTQDKQKEGTNQPSNNVSKGLNIVLGACVVGLVVFYMVGQDDSEAILEEALPRMEAALEREDVFQVYTTARELHRKTNNPLFESYLDKVTSRGDVLANVDGANVSFRFYQDTLETWYELGVTPVTDVRLPYAYLQLKFESGGEEHTTWTHPYYILEGSNKFILPPPGTKEPSAQYVQKMGAKSRLSFPGLDHLDHVEFAPFELAKKEVTNQEYLEFVQAGGYTQDSLWNCPTIIHGEEWSCERLRAAMLDKSGKPGPATWSYSKPLRGQEQHPVSGVSWYEADAYARWRGQSLPTVHQWASSASLSGASRFVPKSNFSKNQLQDVGDSSSLNPQGLFDMAGNVREWVHNKASGEERAILGGCYLDDDYSFNDYSSQHAMDRSSGNGFRVARMLDRGVSYAESFSPVFVETRDFRASPKISDDVFDIYRAEFDNYHKPLRPVVSRAKVPSAGSVVVERVELADIDEGSGEVLPLYVFYDSLQPPPYKPVVFFPGSGAIHMTNTSVMLKNRAADLDYLYANGYALIHPIYTSTYEKEDELKSDYPEVTEFYTDHVLAWGKEYKKTLDYVFSRDDLLSDAVSYYGVSWGGFMANILLAIDDRIEAAVLNVAGLCFQASEPEVEAHNFTQRVTCPVLMLNGKYDVFFPLETSQKPMFEFLATPEADKRHYVFPSGHYVPRDSLVKEHLGWLDTYTKP